MVFHHQHLCAYTPLSNISTPKIYKEAVHTDNLCAYTVTHHPANTQKHTKDTQRDSGLREGNIGVLRGAVCTVASKSLGNSVLYGEDGTTD